MKAIGQTVNMTEKQIEDMLWKEVVRPLLVPQKRAEWMIASLMHEHEIKKQIGKQAVGAATTRIKMLHQLLNSAYEDKAAGKISEEFWSERHHKYTLELKLHESKLEIYREEKDEYIKRGVRLIELAQKLDVAWEKATASEKREIVEAVGSNFVLRNGKLEFSWKKPYHWLAEKPSRTKWWRWRTSSRTPRDRGTVPGSVEKIDGESVWQPMKSTVNQEVCG